jgi:hypothetical protein
LDVTFTVAFSHPNGDIRHFLVLARHKTMREQVTTNDGKAADAPEKQTRLLIASSI